MGREFEGDMGGRGEWEKGRETEKRERYWWWSGWGVGGIERETESTSTKLCCVKIFEIYQTNLSNHNSKKLYPTN